MSNTVDTAAIAELFEEFNVNIEKFNGGNKSAGTRARKALMDISKLCKEIRGEIQEIKNAA